MSLAMVAENFAILADDNAGAINGVVGSIGSPLSNPENDINFMSQSGLFDQQKNRRRLSPQLDQDSGQTSSFGRNH